MYVGKGKEEQGRKSNAITFRLPFASLARNFYHEPHEEHFSSLMVEANNHDAQVICRKVGHGVVQESL